MGDLLEIASVMLAQSTRRVELSGQNLSNIATPGYKAKLNFSSLLDAGQPTSGVGTTADMAEGALIQSGAETDLALIGSGFFTVVTTDGPLFTRQGQFTRDPEGRLVTSQGHALQIEGGRDLVLEAGPFEVTRTGVVLQAERVVGRLAIMTASDPRAVTFADNGLFAIAEDDRIAVDEPTVQQAMLEASNVSGGQEMTAMMQALRQAETAQRLVNVYDDLMGRAITTFAQG